MKRSLRKILCFFLVMLIIPLFSLTASAEDYSAVLNSLDFCIVLMEDGSAYITETREVMFNGDHEFTRLGVNNRFAGPRVFSDWEVSIDGTPVPQLDEPDNENRPENTFAVEDGDGKNTVYIYFRQQGSGTRVFQISYWVENAVKLYSDVGEFFWNLTGETGISDIGTLTATLIVPEGVPDEDFRIWAHGPLNGTFEKQPDGSAALQVDNVSLGTIVDIRTTLPADCFYGGWEQQGEALYEILAEEKELADSANAKREEEERKQAELEAYRAEWEVYHAEQEVWEANHPILNFIERLFDEICYYCDEICYSFRNFMDEIGWNIFCILLFGSFFGFPVILTIHSKIENIIRKCKQKKYRNSPTQSPRYYRDLPDDRLAPAVDRLVHFYDSKSSISRQLSATLLELNLKKLIHFQTTASDATILLNEQLGEELFPSDAPQETAESAQGQEHIPDYQKALWDFLLNAADGSGRISIEDLKKYIKDNRDAALSFRYSFEGAVEREFTKRVKSKDVARYSRIRLKHRLIGSAATGILAILIRMLGTLPYGVEFGESLEFGLGVFVVVAVIEAIIHFWRFFFKTSCYVLNQQGEDDLALWQAFGRFLDDFTTFADKELPEFSVWREYMVYAVAMGKGQKVAKALALKYPEAVSTGTDTLDDDMYRWLQEMALYDAMDSIGREVAEVRAPSSSGGSDSGSDDNWSDSGGGDGGFSDSGGGSDSGSGGGFID